MREFRSNKKNILSKIFIKLCRIFGYEIIDQRPFVKVPFYPGWKVKTIDKKEYSAINQNNFLGFPKEVYGNQIIQIKAQKFFDTRILLLGDAAHSIHPLEGQGLNLTLKGIETLYKLAKNNKIKEDIGSDKILNAFSREQYLNSTAIIFAQIQEVISSPR